MLTYLAAMAGLDLYRLALTVMALFVAALLTGIILILWPRRGRDEAHSQPVSDIREEHMEHMGEHPRVPELPEVKDVLAGRNRDVGGQAGALSALPEHRKPGAHLPDEVEEAPCRQRKGSKGQG